VEAEQAQLVVLETTLLVALEVLEQILIQHGLL
jgi:hypothetical protein